MAKHLQWLISGLMLVSCKSALKPAREPLPKGGPAALALLADDTPLYCPCAELVPIGVRPAFPRVQGTARGPAALQDDCVFVPAAGDAAEQQFSVKITKTNRKMAFDEAQALSDEIKILARERKVFGSSAEPGAASGKAVPFFMALVSNRTGAYRVAVAHAADETLLIETREPVPSSLETLGAVPAYFHGLAERAQSLCR